MVKNAKHYKKQNYKKPKVLSIVKAGSTMGTGCPTRWTTFQQISCKC